MSIIVLTTMSEMLSSLPCGHGKWGNNCKSSEVVAVQTGPGVNMELLIMGTD